MGQGEKGAKREWGKTRRGQNEKGQNNMGQDKTGALGDGIGTVVVVLYY